MKYIVNVDEDNYVTSLEQSKSKKAIEIDDEIATNGFIQCYKYEDGVFTFDENEKTRIDTLASLLAEIQSYDYIGTKIATGVATIEDYKTEIEYMETLREKIRKVQHR